MHWHRRAEGRFNLSIQVSPDLYYAMKDRIDEEGVSQTDFIRHALAEAVAKSLGEPQRMPE